MTNAHATENLCMLVANMLTLPLECQPFLQSGGMELLVQALRTHPDRINVANSACCALASITVQSNNEMMSFMMIWTLSL
jgi:hypothetical protein